MSSQTKLVLRGIFLILAIISLGCSKIDFKENASVSSSEVGDLGQPVAVDDGVEDLDQQADLVSKSCVDAAQGNRLIAYTQEVTFENTKVESGRAQVCEFGKNDNLAMRDGYSQARYEQNAQLTLPAGAVLCDMEIESNQQTFKYDDVFYLSLNNYVLASNNKRSLPTTGVVADIGDYYYLRPCGPDGCPAAINVPGRPVTLIPYLWESVRGKPFDNNGNDDYCLGQQLTSYCNWPITEQVGKIKLMFDQRILVNLSLRKTAPTDQLKFVITGDNNPSDDCFHETLKLKVTSYYYSNAK